MESRQSFHRFRKENGERLCLGNEHDGFKKGQESIHVCLVGTDSYMIDIIAKKMFHIEQNLYIFSQAIGLVLFEKVPVSEFFNRIDNSKLEPENHGQGWYSKFLWTLVKVS